MENITNYKKYRGKCKQLSDELVANNPELSLVRGYYYCPMSDRTEQHWWTKDEDGIIHDPSKLQFLSGGMGEYMEFDGTVECSNCGKKMTESEAIIDGRYTLCSSKCYGQFVGCDI